MQKRTVHQCECPECQQAEANATQELHAQINFLLSTLDERQRRLYAGLESKKFGYGGDHRLATITGLDVGTIAKGRRELEQAEGSDYIRQPGGGRLRVEKKTQRL
jgi:hypothetical protein